MPVHWQPVVCCDSADVFWLSCRTVFCVQRTAGIVLLFFCFPGFDDMSKLFGHRVEAKVPILYCQWQHCFVCMYFA